MEMIFRNIPLARSGNSDKRGDLNVGMLCMIPAHSYSKLATVHYKNIAIGVVRNLTFADLHNGVAELRGDIILRCGYSTIAEMAFDEVYPSISVSTTPNIEASTNPYLYSLSLVNREEREFEDQQPLDLSGLRVLVKATAESEAPVELFRKQYNLADSGLIGFAECNTQKPQAVRLVSSFIPAINAYGNDEKTIDLIRRIITVVGASENCRQDEIEAAYKMSLEELIDRLVRDWHAAFRPSNYYDIKENNAAITFDNEGEDVGNDIMRYGYYRNGALMGYVVCGVTEFCGDYRPRHPLDILEKFVEHQRNKQKI